MMKFFLMQCSQIGGFVDSDVEIVKFLVSFFKPFYTITKQLESEKKATIHEVIPLFCFLERHILTVDQSAPFKEAIFTANKILMLKRIYFLAKIY